MMNQLSGRQKELLSLLSHESDFRTSAFFSGMLHISTKTLMRDVQQINELWRSSHRMPEHLILSERGKGHKLNENYLNLFTMELMNSSNYSVIIPDVQKDRVNWILGQISRYTLGNQSFLLDTLADDLYVSLTTIKKDMQLVKEILKQSGLTLIKYKNSGLKLAGEEKDIRNFLVRHAFQEAANARMEKIYSGTQERMQLISKVVLSALQEHQIRITDFGHHNLVIHIEVLIQRVLADSRHDYLKQIHADEMKSAEYRAAKTICHRIQDLLTIEIPASETANIYFHLISQKLLFNRNANIFIQIQYQGLFDILNQAFDKLYELYQIPFQSDELLYNGLFMHLNCAIIRLRYEIPIRNELIDEILIQFPFEMQLAKILTHKIEENLGYIMNLEETGFLALHFCGAIERIKEKDRIEQIKLVIIGAATYSASQFLIGKLKNHFGNRVAIKDVLALYELEHMDAEYLGDVDLIVNTAAKEIHAECLVVQISSIPTDADIRKIEECVLMSESQHNICSLLHRDLFFYHPEIRSKEEIFALFAGKIKEFSLADEECINSIYEREQMGATEIGNLVAIPHSIRGTIHRPAILVLILEKPIMWMHTEVQLVFLILMDKSQGSYKNLFKSMFHYINDPYKIKKIISHGTFAYLMNVFQ